MLALFMAIAIVESGLDSDAVGDNGSAVGIVQIRPGVVRDCNDWMAKQRYPLRFTLDDRKSVSKSWHMFRIYMERWAKGKSPEYMARVWNGGPRGPKRKSTEAYWRRVESVLKMYQKKGR